MKLEVLPNEEVEVPKVSIDELRDASQKAGFYDRVDKNPEPGRRHRTKLNPEQRGVLNDSIKKSKVDENQANKKVRINGPHAERVAPGIFGQKEDNEIMQKDMDALFRAMSPAKLQNKNKPATLIKTEPKQENMKLEISTLEGEKEGPQTNESTVIEHGIKDWQNEAIKNFESSGKSVPDFQITKEEPANYSIKNWQDEAIKGFEKAGDKVLDTETKEPKDSHTLDVEQAGDFIKAQEGLKAAGGAVETRAMEAGVPLGIIGKVGELYNKSSPSFKWAISGALLASVVGGGLIGAAGLLGTAGAIGIGMRALGGAGLFVTLENALKNSYEKARGKEREEGVKARHTAEAAALAISLGVFIPDIIRTGLQATGLSDVVLNKLSGNPMNTTSPEIPQAQATVEYIKDVKAGDSVWKLASGIVSEKFPNLSPEQQTYFTDAIKDRIVKHPESFGIEGSDANNLAVGEKIDFGGILNNEEFMSKTLADAQNLSSVEPSNTNIHNNNLEIAKEAESEPDLILPIEPPQESQTTLEPVINTNAFVDTGVVKGSFQYDASGKITGVSVSGQLEIPQNMEALKLLNDNWRGTVLEKGVAGVGSLNTEIVQNNARLVFLHEQILNTLEQKGEGGSPEASFLREQVGNIITNTEKTYGDVFKDLAFVDKNLSFGGGAPQVTQIIDWPTDPQTIADGKKVTDLNIKSVFGKEGGWFGIGATDGQEIFKNFADNTVEDIISRKDKIPSVDMDKLINMLEGARKQTGIPWDSKITVRDYLDFSAATDIENYKKGR